MFSFLLRAISLTFPPLSLLHGAGKSFHFSASLQIVGGNTNDDEGNDYDDEPEDKEIQGTNIYLFVYLFYEHDEADRNHNNHADNSGILVLVCLDVKGLVRPNYVKTHFPTVASSSAEGLGIVFFFSFRHVRV